MKTTISNIEAFEKRMKNVFKASKATISDVMSEVMALNPDRDFMVASVWNRSSSMYRRDGTFAIIGNAEIRLDYYDNNWKGFFKVVKRK